MVRGLGQSTGQIIVRLRQIVRLRRAPEQTLHVTGLYGANARSQDSAHIDPVKGSIGDEQRWSFYETHTLNQTDTIYRIFLP